MATNKTVRVVTGAHPAQYRSCSIISAATGNTFPIYAQTSADDRTFETIHDAGAPPVTGLKEVVVLGYTRSGNSVTVDATGAMTAFNSTSLFSYTGLTSTASANLIVCVVSCLANSPPTSVTWDTAGANQTMTQLATQSTAGGAVLRMYGLISPGSSGNKTISIACSATFTYAASAVSFIGANSTLANAVPAANIIQGASAAGGVASWNISSNSDSITVASGHQCVIANMCGNGSSSSATWTTNSGSTSFSRTAYYVSSGTATLTITPNVNEQCAGMAIDVSP